MPDEDFDRFRDRNRAVLETSKHLFEEAKQLMRIAKLTRDRSRASVAKAQEVIKLRAVPAFATKPD